MDDIFGHRSPLLTAGAEQVVLTGGGHVLLDGGDSDENVDSRPYLRSRKTRKYMGLQDELAVIAAGRALDSAGLRAEPDAFDGQRCGVFLVVGHIPFEARDIDTLMEGAAPDGELSLPAFTSTGFRAVSPLLTFRCLPNMPAFHISTNFAIQGPSLVTFPGPGQFYNVLSEAAWQLAEGRIDVAVVGGIAHQRNFLVEQHLARLDVPPDPTALCDAAGCLILERRRHADERGATVRGCCAEIRASARSPHLLERDAPFRESFEVAGSADSDGRELGAASLPVRLVERLAGGPGGLAHELNSRDGVDAMSVWEVT